MREHLWIPAQIHLDETLPLSARYLYILALATRPDSIDQLRRLAGMSRQSVFRATKILSEKGWIRMVKSSYRKEVVPLVPDEIQRQQAEKLREVKGMAAYLGEFLMKRWLDVLVDSDNFIDNARPGFLRNPKTGQPLEYDRYYLEGVAFEFNGIQHYETSQQFPNEELILETQIRDLLKIGLSHRKGVVLVEVVDEDLNLKNMLQKIPSKLPLHRIDENGPYIRALEEISKEHILNMAKKKRKEPDRSA